MRGITNSMRGEEGPAGRQAWLVTFNDMITLLMVFFVLLFSMGSIDKKRFAQFQHGLQSAVGILDEGKHAASDRLPDRFDSGGETPADSHATGSDPVAMIAQLTSAGGLEAEYTHKGIQLRLNDELLFALGSTSLTQEGAGLLNRVSAVIAPMDRDIRVEGHSDDLPIATARYPSNWELSIARAISVVNYFITNGKIPAKRLSVAGYGASRPRMPNDSDSHRAANRRVEIFLSPGAVSKTEALDAPSLSGSTYQP